MSGNVSLDRFMVGPGDARGVTAAHLFSSGLQDILTAIAGVCMSAVDDEAEVPGGLTGRFAAAFTKPSLGAIREFILWLSSRVSCPSMTELAAFLEKDRKPGWLGKMVQLRNRWVHPKEETPADVEKHAQELIADAPDFASLGRIETDTSGALRWCGAAGAHALDPWAWRDGDAVRFFTAFTPPDRLLFGEGDAPTQARFAETWRRLRMADPSLDDPTPDEFHARARDRTGEYVGEAPWWLAKVISPGASGVLVASGSLDGALAHAGSASPGCSTVDVGCPADGKTPEAAAERLGLARPVDVAALGRFAEPRRPVILAIRAGGLDSRTFAQALYWLADLRESGHGTHVRVLVERSLEGLQRDQETLWDRLPDRLPGVLRAPPRSDGAALPDFLWTAKRKRFLGLF